MSDVTLTEAEWDDLRAENMYDTEESVRRYVDRLLVTRVQQAKAEALRDAAAKVYTFRDWYPLSVFPSLDEALADDYEPTAQQIAAESYRHAYGEVVPRNLRAMADALTTDGGA